MRNYILVILGLFLAKAEAQTSALAVADSLYVSGDYINAINTYATLGTPSANLQIARAYNAIGNRDKSIVQYEHLVEEDPKQQIARFELGKQYMRTKVPEKALNLFLKLTQENDGNPEYQYQLGRCLMEMERPKMAINSFKRAFTLDSTHLRSIFQLGKYHVIRKEKDLALQYVNVGLDFYGNDISLINWKALALYNDDQYELAIPWLEKLIELGEKKEYIYTKLAYSYYQNWEMEKAKETYRVLLEMDEDNNEAYYNLAQVFLKERKLDSAEYYVQKSIDVQKVNFEMEYVTLGRVAGQQKNLKKALEYYWLAYNENTSNYANYFQICFIADQYYKESDKKLKYYENFIEKFGIGKSGFSEHALRRISEIKAEMHFSKE